MKTTGPIRFGVTHGLRGYFAIMYDDDGPINSGVGSYETAEGAAHEAQEWARSEFGDSYIYHLDKTARED